MGGKKKIGVAGVTDRNVFESDLCRLVFVVETEIDGVSVSSLIRCFGSRSCCFLSFLADPLCIVVCVIKTHAEPL